MAASAARPASPSSPTSAGSRSRGRSITRSRTLGTAASCDEKRLDPAEELTVPAAFADLVGYHLRIAQEASFLAIRQGVGQIVGGADVRPGWYTVLTILADNPGLTPSELSRLCGRDRSTLAGTLKDLAARRLISRRRKRHDQRSYVVRLTPGGEEVLARMREFSLRHDARLDEIVGTDKAMLIALLRRIAFELGPDRMSEGVPASRPAAAQAAPPRAVASGARTSALADEAVVRGSRRRDRDGKD